MTSSNEYLFWRKRQNQNSHQHQHQHQLSPSKSQLVTRKLQRKQQQQHYVSRYYHKKNYSYSYQGILGLFMCLCFMTLVYYFLFPLSSPTPIPTTKTNVHPRHLGCYFSTSRIVGVERLKVYWNRYPSKRLVWEDDEHVEYVQHKLLNSKKYRYSLRDEPYLKDECTLPYEWQSSSHPNCNFIHEMDLSSLHHHPTTTTNNNNHQDKYFLKHWKEKQVDRVTLLTNGYWRDVWNVQDTIAMKTLRLIHEFDDRNYDRHRRDAIAMEHLSQSPYILDIYGYCSNTALHPYSSQGDINDLLWPLDPESNDTDPSSQQLLQMAQNITLAIHHVHTIDHPTKPSMAHTDITTGQFVNINGTYQLNDFNRVRFISIQNDDKDQICPYRIGRNPGKVSIPMYNIISFATFETIMKNLIEIQFF